MKWREYKTNSKLKLEYQTKAGLDLIKLLYDDAKEVQENINKNN